MAGQLDRPLCDFVYKDDPEWTDGPCWREATHYQLLVGQGCWEHRGFLPPIYGLHEDVGVQEAIGPMRYRMFRALCSCGWEGAWQKDYGTAWMDGPWHRVARTALDKNPTRATYVSWMMIAGQRALVAG